MPWWVNGRGHCIAASGRATTIGTDVARKNVRRNVHSFLWECLH
jgi:hypothetical protein